jgi:hypothetical protein
MTSAARWVILCTYIIICQATISGCGGKSMMPLEKFVITIQYPTEDRGFTCDLRVDQTGLTEWTVRSNSLTSEDPTVGVYQTNIGPQRASELRTTLEMLDKRGLPAHEPLPPGEDLPVISLEQNGQVRSERVDPHLSSPAICKTSEHFKGVILQARRNPIRTITLKTSVHPDAVLPNQPLRFSLFLEANGTENVQVAYPAPKSTRLGGVIVWAMRSDIPIEERWPQHSKQLTLAAEHLIEKILPQPGDENYLVLSPAQTAQFQCSVPMDWEPGEYDLRIIYFTLGSDPSVLNGRITSQPTTLTVRPQ